MGQFFLYSAEATGAASNMWLFTYEMNWLTIETGLIKYITMSGPFKSDIEKDLIIQFLWKKRHRFGPKPGSVPFPILSTGKNMSHFFNIGKT